VEFAPEAYDWPMRIAIATESFLPDVNGVTNSVLRVIEHLHKRGHQALVVAPGSGVSEYLGTPVERVPSVVLERYGEISVGLPGRRISRVLASYRPDVVHVAAPVVVGRSALNAARRLRMPTVAVYQTDLPGFMREYGLGLASRQVWSALRRIHARADLTLAPSVSSVDQLRAHGVRGVMRWPRGVDQQRFGPHRRDELLRHRWTPHDRLLVGYVGRLAPEKGLDRLVSLDADPRVQLVIVGDGPERDALRRRLPDAVFTGHLGGDELAAAFASLDVFVHPGLHETFCQAVQEALSSGVPVVAPAMGGPLDTVHHGFNGRRWDPARPHTLHDEVIDLLDTETREALARRARLSVRGQSWEAVGDQLIEHYQRLVEATAPRPADAA